MSPAVADMLPELVVLAAAICCLLASYFLENTAQRKKLFGWLFGVLAVLSVVLFFNFGSQTGGGRLVHVHEQYHFFLGSKYLKELRYDAIYEAGILAARESGVLRNSEIKRRNPMDFKLTVRPITRERQAELRRRFGQNKWRSFRDDVQFFGDPGTFVVDHGNTGSPTWAMTASLFTRTLPLNSSTTMIFGCLDLLLLVILFLAVWDTFGGRTLQLTLIVGLSVPLIHAYLLGSILRMDWIVALGISVCLFEKRHYRSAGLLLGYAIAVKLLAGIMVIPFGLRFLVKTVRNRRVNRDHLRYIVFAGIGLVCSILLAALYFWDAQLWQDYFQRLLVTLHEHYYRSQHSFRDLFLQAYHDPGSLRQLFPETIAASETSHSIQPLRGLFAVAQATLLVGLVVVAVRNSARYAFALGPLAVFLLLVSNRYYWQMWIIAAIVLAPSYRTNWRHLGYLCLILVWLGSNQIVSRSGHDDPWGGYFGSYALFWILAALLGFELIAWWRTRAASPTTVRRAD